MKMKILLLFSTCLMIQTHHILAMDLNNSDNDDDVYKQMQQTMGMTNFGSSKGKDHKQANDGAVNIKRHISPLQHSQNKKKKIETPEVFYRGMSKAEYDSMPIDWKNPTPHKKWYQGKGEHFIAIKEEYVKHLARKSEINTYHSFPIIVKFITKETTFDELKKKAVFEPKNNKEEIQFSRIIADYLGKNYDESELYKGHLAISGWTMKDEVYFKNESYEDSKDTVTPVLNIGLGNQADWFLTSQVQYYAIVENNTVDTKYNPAFNTKCDPDNFKNETLCKSRSE